MTHPARTNVASPVNLYLAISPEGRTRRVTCWRPGEMALHCAGAAGLETEKSFRKIVGHQGLWMLKAALHEGPSASK